MEPMKLSNLKWNINAAGHILYSVLRPMLTQVLLGSDHQNKLLSISQNRYKGATS
jgi:hypothetical protein